MKQTAQIPKAQPIFRVQTVLNVHQAGKLPSTRVLILNGKRAA
jgi:hypothetical protein